MEPGDHGTSAASDSSGMLLQQFTSQQECEGGNQRHQQQEDGQQPQQQQQELLQEWQQKQQEELLQGWQQQQQQQELLQGWQQQQEQQQELLQGWQQQHQSEDHSNQHEQLEQSRPQHPEKSQPQLHEQNEHRHLEPTQQQQQEQQQQQPVLQDKQLHQMMEIPEQRLQHVDSQQRLQQLLQPQQHPQKLPLQLQQQHLSEPQHQLQQQLSEPQHQPQQQLQESQQQQLQQLPPQSQQQPLQQLPPPQQPPQQQHHLQQSTQSQQVPQQLQQLTQSQQQSQQHLQQSTLQPHQQHLQQLLQPQQNQQQQLSLQPQQQHSQKLPQPQHQPQQQLQQSPLPSQQQLSQPKQELQQQQLQPQGQQQRQFNNQQPLQSAVGQTTSSTRGQSASHSISFGSLIPMILPHLSKEQADRLHLLYSKLRRNEVTKEDFLRATRNVVGDQMLVQAVRQMQLKQQAQSQSTSSSQPNQQQQQHKQQQHTQGSSQQFTTQQLHEPQPFQQVPAVSAQQQTQRTLDFQTHSQTSAAASVSHLSDNKPQQLRQAGEQRSEISSVHVNQTSTMNLHQVKHDVDRTMVGFPPSIQQQQQNLQVSQSPFSMYGRTPGNYSSQSFSVAPSVSPSAVKAPTQDSQTRQVIHPQVGVQAQGGPPQLSNTKTVPKYDLSKLPKRREEEERQKMLQSGGTSHFSGQHQPSIWETRLDKEQAVNTGIPPSTSVHVKQEVIDNSVQQHNLQNLQPMADNLSTLKGVNLDHGQSVLQKPEGVEHQIHKASSISSANISTANQPLVSTGTHSNHVMQAPLATSSAATLHHTLSAFGGPISGSHSSGNLLQVQARIQVPSTPPSSAIGSQIKTPPKKPLIGQKKPFEVTGPSMQLPSKKQKVSGGYLDQSIDQLNDVTAVSGVNLREEEEQLFAGPKEESRATEAMRRVVQEEEERTFLQKGPLHAKLAGIMAKYGIKYISSDSERCMSLSVEERLRTMIGHLIRLSKQRVDIERVNHKVCITSDVRRQIQAMNKKAKEDLEKKQAEEAEKLRKSNEAENNFGPEGEKDENRAKAQRAQKEEDDKMRANAANVAARAAVGGDDMLSKWQMMAEQARQKREGTSDGASSTRTNRDVNRKSVVGGLKTANISDHQDAPSTGIVRNLGRNLGPLSQTKPVRTICIKDVIALLEREPQMCKSSLLYRLYERGSEYKEKECENQNNENTLQ